MRGRSRQVFVPLDAAVDTLCEASGARGPLKSGATYLADRTRSLASYGITSGATLEDMMGGLRGGGCCPSKPQDGQESGLLQSVPPPVDIDAVEMHVSRVVPSSAANSSMPERATEAAASSAASSSMPERMRGQTQGEAGLLLMSVQQQADALFDELTDGALTDGALTDGALTDGASKRSIPVSALVERLRLAGQDEARARQLHEALDTDGDGSITRDEWRKGLTRAAGDEGVRAFGLALMTLMAAFPVDESVTFDDLPEPGGGAGCDIAQTELRAITVPQLTRVGKHLLRRCEPEGWRSWTGDRLTPSTVSLYDATAFMIKPATRKRRCSFVEFVANGAQRPSWFVSHWWGESVVDFIRCLEQHRKDRALAEDMAYWVRRRAAAKCKTRQARRAAPPCA